MNDLDAQIERALPAIVFIGVVVAIVVLCKQGIKLIARRAHQKELARLTSEIQQQNDPKGKAQTYAERANYWNTAAKLRLANYTDNDPKMRICNESAIADYTMAMELDPEINVYWSRGKCLVELQNWDAALRDFTKALHLKPSPGLYLERAKIYSRLSQFELVIDDCTNGLPLGVSGLVFSHRWELLRQRADAYSALGMKKEAAADRLASDEEFRKITR